MINAKVTIICCYNNKKVFDGFIKTISQQNCPCEIIAINNSGNKNFTSCAAAYNSVIEQVKTKYVVYSHQDILLDKPDTLEKFINVLDTLQPDDILGVAGVIFEDHARYVYTNIHQFFNKELKYASDYRVVGNVMKCDTVDECFFGGFSEHFKNYPFDEKICDNWHLYAAEACLRTKAISGTVWICNTDLTHLSIGKVSIPFYRNFYAMCRKYRNVFPFIRTTCAETETSNAGLYYFKTTLWLLLEKIHIYNFLRKALCYDVIKKFLMKPGIFAI